MIRRLRRRPKWCLGLIFALLVYRFAFASFENTFLGARPAGLANSFTAVSDDINSIYFNPAGLARIHQPESLIQGGRLRPRPAHSSQVDGRRPLARPTVGRRARAACGRPPNRLNRTAFAHAHAHTRRTVRKPGC